MQQITTCRALDVATNIEGLREELEDLVSAAKLAADAWSPIADRAASVAMALELADECEHGPDERCAGGQLGIGLALLESVAASVDAMSEVLGEVESAFASIDLERGGHS